MENGYQNLLDISMEGLRIKTDLYNNLWHISEAEWSIDQNSSEVVFTSPRGLITTCKVQLIGTFDTNDSTWLWGWDHPSVKDPVARHAKCLYEYGLKNGIIELTTRKLSTTELHCWEFTALAMKLNEAQGGYRAPAGNALVFITFDEPSISSID